ncbi:unnamed protein product [Nippostrongylus brasiliensis]|uniref:WS_DGAT_C domain-containing protein n=1 Tax=Nippostrongylus brasiliensis TaxID=27835 RepID=A0A0N4XH51_NIPBR|nr:unnamed protein product [Nippostrongylus brasiliensis]
MAGFYFGSPYLKPGVTYTLVSCIHEAVFQLDGITLHISAAGPITNHKDLLADALHSVKTTIDWTANKEAMSSIGTLFRSLVKYARP